MTKVSNTQIPEDIHLNIEKTFEFIRAWLPRNYTREVNKLLDPEDRVDESYIRKVKQQGIRNKKIYTAMYRIALFQKLQLEKISNQ